MGQQGYRAERIAEAMHVCVCGQDYAKATIHDTRHEAEEAARARNLNLLVAAKRVTAAFRAHGESRSIGSDFQTRRECESAMVSLDAAIADSEAS